MKKLITRSILFAVLLSAIFAIVSFTQSNSSNHEVLLVEVGARGSTLGVFIFHDDRPTEFIEIDISKIEKVTEEVGETVRSTLQNLYNEGWKLEGTSGGDTSQRYILTK